LAFRRGVWGARRDEEKSRAKERTFSHRSAAHAWDPRNQRPELWQLFNTRIKQGESMRVFPLSNWTELDVWDYILVEDIPVVPLYLAKERPVVERDGTLIMVDDERLPLRLGEVPRMEHIRFRTLGCYPDRCDPLASRDAARSGRRNARLKDIGAAGRLMITTDPARWKEKREAISDARRGTNQPAVVSDDARAPNPQVAHLRLGR
jgi:3'-phosphoadenosine 5'-phosphosulfate sulfotransferase (PAPS reductase)/FAD synthetase